MLVFYLTMIDNEEHKNRFEEIYLTYKKSMLNLAFSYLKDSYEAEDAVHTAFFNIAKNMSKINSLSHNDAKNYCFKAVKNASIDMLKKKQKIKEVVLNETVACSDDLFNEICEKSSVEAIKKALLQLDETYKDVITMHFLYDMSVGEISNVFGRNSSTIRTQLSRGKSKLCELLKKEGFWKCLNLIMNY